MTIPTLTAALLLATASIASAQTSPSIDCAPLTVPQAQYWLDHGLCATMPRDLMPKPATWTPAPEPTDTVCLDVNPYTQGDLATQCANRPTPTDAVPTFLVGRVYAFGYDELRARVLGLAQDIDGVQVVTVRWLSEASSITAFRTPPTPGGASSWALVTP